MPIIEGRISTKRQAILRKAAYGAARSDWCYGRVQPVHTETDEKESAEHLFFVQQYRKAHHKLTKGISTNANTISQ
jgi:hypothetical protein